MGVYDLSDLVTEIRKCSKDIEIASILMIAWDRGIAAEQRRICEIVRHQATNPQALLQAIKRPQR